MDQKEKSTLVKKFWQASGHFTWLAGDDDILGLGEDERDNH